MSNRNGESRFETSLYYMNQLKIENGKFQNTIYFHRSDGYSRDFESEFVVSVAGEFIVKESIDEEFHGQKSRKVDVKFRSAGVKRGTLEGSDSMDRKVCGHRIGDLTAKEIEVKDKSCIMFDVKIKRPDRLFYKDNGKLQILFGDPWDSDSNGEVMYYERFNK